MSVKKGAGGEALSALLDAAAAHYSAGRLDEAARLYRKVETAHPLDFRAAYSLAVIDIRAGRNESARRRLRTVIARDPALFAAWQNLGAVCESLGLWAEAAETYRQALNLRSDVAETGFGLARALAVVGRIDEAADCYRALAADPIARPRALSRLAILDPGAMDDAELEALRRDSADADPETRIAIQFALGGVLERRGADDAAFAAFAEGNRLKHQALSRASVGTHPDAIAKAHAETIDYLESQFSPAFIARHHGRGHRTASPIFIVGMPRSGSSLIEQILASHPQVQGMGESAALSDVVDRDFAGGDTAPAAWRRMADDYLIRMRSAGWLSGRRLIDKTLENDLRVGLIHLMFPHAVILHAARDPLDTSLACFRQLFSSGNETLYDLRQIGETYGRHGRIMAHWAKVLPGRVIEVGYEALVADPETQIRWLVTEACGLDWDPRCLDFHMTANLVRTASAAQVRQPVFQTSLARWKRYEAHLGPLFEALGPYGADRGA